MQTIQFDDGSEVQIVERDARNWPGDGVGIHRLDPDERDVEDALEVAARDGFETIYVYRTRDLRLVK